MLQQAEKVDLHRIIVETALRDGEFRRALLADAKQALRDWRFVDLPDDIRIVVHEDSETTVNLVVPHLPSELPVDALSDAELMEAVGIGAIPSRTTGSEVRTCCSNANCC